jgi:pimeloyl-ACP methyl ester carboxylesterase
MPQGRRGCTAAGGRPDGLPKEITVRSLHHGQALREPKSKHTRRLALLTAAGLGLGMLAASVPGRADAASAQARAPVAPANACSALTSLKLTSTAVASATEDTSGKFTIPPGQPGAGTVLTSLPAFCAVALTQTNPPAHDQIHVEVWLPLTTWKGDFQGVGGGSFVSGISWSELATALQSGYSTASTDTGHTVQQGETGSFAIGPNGALTDPEITDYAYRAIHEMTVAGKDITTAFYGSQARYSYFNGCSTGGRQGLAEAERYPRDYNGILAGAPAVYMDQLNAAQLWPELVMLRAHDFLPQCKLSAFTSAAIKQCEVTKGVNYGEIMDPFTCSFSAYTLVGTKTDCGTITRTDARVMEEIWAGPTGTFRWYGLEPGAGAFILADTATRNGVTTPEPFFIPIAWFRYWVTQNPDFNWQTMSLQEFSTLAGAGVSKFPELEDGNPNLSAFQRAGGKLLLWAGLADQVIPPGGVISYYNNVQAAMGTRLTQSFARLFLAPGAGHCGLFSAGPVPANPLGALVNWVQNGMAPSSILATTVSTSGQVAESRPLCAYPDGTRYTGHGSLTEAQNFVCAPIFTSQRRPSPH